VLEAAIGWLGKAAEERMEAARSAAVVADFNLRGAGIQV
jgi:hypothetical protein